MSVNKVILIGNLGADPDVHQFQDGSEICNLSVATSRSWRDKSTNDKREETEWHRVVVRGSAVNFCARYLTKGRTVYVEGSLKTRKYDDKDGSTRYTTEVNAYTVQAIGGRSDGDGGQRNDSGRGRPRGPSGPEPYDPGGYDPGGYTPGPKDDDIPF